MVSTALRYFSESPLPMQRASIEAAAALMSSGNSRNTKRTLPVSIYFDRSIGNTFWPKAAQCGQLIEEYSVMVIGAFSDPMAMSGSETGFATAAAIALCARAVAGTAGDAKARRAAKAMRQRTFNGYSETYWGKRRASSSCGLLIILLVLRAKGHLD